MKKKAFITGATGFIGSHLAEKLIEKDYEVTCLVRRTSNLRWLEKLPVKYHTGEISDKDSVLEGVRRQDYIFHLAGLTKAIKPVDYYRVNADGTKNMIEATLEAGHEIKRFVLLSSLAAAGPSPDALPIDEKTPPRPITDYGRSKLEAEKITESFRSQIPISIVRPPAVYGPRDKDIYLYFKMVNKGWSFLLGSHDQVLSFVYAPDLAESVIKVAECEESSGETYFASNPEPYTWSYVGSVIEKSLDKTKCRKIRIPFWMGNIIARIVETGTVLTKSPAVLNRQKILEAVQPYWVCSPEKLNRDTGFSCSTDIEKGMKNTALWYKKMGWL